MKRGLAGLEMLQAGVQDFFNAVELGAPEVAHIVEALVQGVEPGIDGGKLGIHFGVQQAHKDRHPGSVEHQRDADREIELKVRHHKLSALRWQLFSHNADSGSLIQIAQPPSTMWHWPVV